jgi:hypothetical protein
VQFSIGAVGGVLVLGVCVFDRDLTVVRPVGDEEWHGDVLDHSLEADSRRELYERVKVVLAPHPLDVLPVVRDGVLAFALGAAAREFSPVVVACQAK